MGLADRGAGRPRQAKLPGSVPERPTERERGAGRHDRPLAEQPAGEGAPDRQGRDPQDPVLGGVERAAGPRRAQLAGGLGHLGERLLGPLPARGLDVALGVRRCTVQLVTDLDRRRTADLRDNAEHIAELGGQDRDPARRDARQRTLEYGVRVVEPLAHRGRDVLAGGRGSPSYGGRAELVREGVGGGGDELVGLVDDDRVVLGQDLRTGEGVQGQQRVVGHDDVGVLGLLPGELTEAVDAVRALRTEALAGADADLAPGPVADGERHLVAVAGGGGRGPLPELHHLRADHRGRPVPQLVLLGLAGTRPLVQLLQAHVVAPALGQGEGRAPAQRSLQGVAEPREVLVDELCLQGLGGRRHDDRPATGQRRHQVRQRLAGPRAGLDQQVLPAAQGGVDGLRHGLLALAHLGAGDHAEGGLQQRLRRTPCHGSSSRVGPDGSRGPARTAGPVQAQPCAGRRLASVGQVAAKPGCSSSSTTTCAPTQRTSLLSASRAWTATGCGTRAITVV